MKTWSPTAEEKEKWGPPLTRDGAEYVAGMILAHWDGSRYTADADCSMKRIQKDDSFGFYLIVPVGRSTPKRESRRLDNLHSSEDAMLADPWAEQKREEVRAFAIAHLAPPPETDEQRKERENAGYNELIRSCWNLAGRRPSNPFFLSIQAACGWTRCSRECVEKWLGEMITWGLLRKVADGDYAKRRAAQYEFIPSRWTDGPEARASRADAEQIGGKKAKKKSPKPSKRRPYVNWRMAFPTM